MSISREDYLAKYGGQEAWATWLETAKLPEDVKTMARAGVIQGDEEAWQGFRNWGNKHVWNARYDYDIETWKGIAAQTGLPEKRLSESSQQEIAAQAEKVKNWQSPNDIRDWKAGDGPPVSQELTTDVWQELSVAQTMDEKLQAIKNAGPAAIKYVQDLALVNANFDINPTMIMNDIIEDTWSVVDILIPKSVQKALTRPTSFTIPYINENDKKIREELGFGETFTFNPFENALQAVEQGTEWLEKYEDIRVGHMREAGVSDEAIGLMEGVAEFEAIAVEFTKAPAASMVRGKKALTGVNKLVQAAGKTPNAKDVARVSEALNRTSRLARSHGGFVDEITKGAFVGFYSGEGGVREKLHESMVWAGLGGLFGGATRAWRSYFGFNHVPILNKMMQSSMTPQEAVQTFSMAGNADRGALISLIQRAGGPEKVQSLQTLSMLAPDPEHAPVIQEHTKILRELEKLGEPIELQTQNAMRQQEQAIQKAAAEGQVIKPVPEEVIAQDLLKQKQEYQPALEKAIRDLESQHPEVFPNPTDLPEFVEGRVVLKDGVKEDIGQALERKVEYVSAPMIKGGKVDGFEVIKNPSPQDLSQLAKEYRKNILDRTRLHEETVLAKRENREFGIRFLYDAQGNRYAWRADQVLHEALENAAVKKFGIEKVLRKPLIKEAGGLYESSLTADVQVGDLVKHTKWGPGTVMAHKGDMFTLSTNEGIRTAKAHKSWSVQRGAAAPTYSSYDRIKWLVEEKKLSHRAAKIYLIQSRLKANDPAARWEAINMMVDDLFTQPELLAHKTEGWSQPALELLGDYMQNPLGQHPGFQWGDLNAIKRIVDEKGYMPIFTVPYNAWDEAGQFVAKGGPRGRAYGQVPKGVQDTSLLGHRNAMHTYKGGAEEGAAHKLATEKGMPAASAGFDEDLATLYRSSHRPGEVKFGEAPGSEVKITTLTERLAEKGYTVRNMPPGEVSLPYAEDILMVYPVQGFKKDKRLINLEMRRETEIGFTDAQQMAHWEEAASFINKPENWALIKPKVPPAVYTDDAANTLNRYLANKPILGEGLETFHPQKSGMAVINPAMDEVFGVPVTSEAAGDVLQTAGMHLNRPPTGLSLVAKDKDGTWKIIAGPGEASSHELLVDEVANEIGKIGRDSLMAKNMRTEVTMGERAQRLAKRLKDTKPKTYDDMVAAGQLLKEKGPKIQSTTRPLSLTEQVLLKSSESSIDPVTGLLTEEAMENLMATGSAVLMQEGKRVGVARVHASNLSLAKKIMSEDDMKVLFSRIAKNLKGVADKHNLVIGRGAGSRFTIFGDIQNPVQLKKDLNKSFRSLLDDAPEVMQLFYGKDGPVLLTPAFGSAVGRDIPVATLLEEADGLAHQFELMLKAQAAADGWMVQRGFAIPKRLDDGTFEFTARTGEVFKAKPGDGSLWEEIAYARILDQGGLVKAKGGKWAVVKDGEVQYMSKDSRRIAFLESNSDPLAEVSLDSVMAEALGKVGGMEGGVGLMNPTSPLEMAPGIAPKRRGKGEWISYMLQPTKTVMDNIEKNSGIPAAQWYHELESKYQQISAIFMEKKRMAWEISKGHGSRKTQGFVSQVLLAPKSERASLIEGLSPKDKEYYKQMRWQFNEFWEEIGVPKEHWDDVLNMIQARIGGKLPQELAETEWMRKLTPIFSAYELGALRVDVAAMHAKLWRSHLREKYMRPAAQAIKKSFRDIPPEEVPLTSKKAIMRMVDLFDNSPDHDFISGGEWLANRKLFNMFFGDTERAYEVAQQIPALMLSMQYFSSMAFRLGLPFRNLFQPFITTAPLIGTRDTLAGWKMAAKKLRGEDPVFDAMLTGKLNDQVLKELGQIQEYLPVVSGDALSSFTTANGYINSIHQWTRRGLWMQAKTDKLNRLVSFYGSVNRSTRYLKRALDGKKDFEWFASHADLNMFHETDRLRWKKMWDAAGTADGEWKTLVLDVAKRVGDESQFIYASYANPRMFHHVLTKMGFQYGIWPINYFNMLTQRGIVNSQAKFRFWRRILGVHGTLAATGTAAGVDMKDWAFFSPLEYTGGPYLQFGVNMLHAVQGRPEARTDRVIDVMGRMSKNFIPGLYKTDGLKAYDYMVNGDPIGAILAMFRLKPWYGDEDQEMGEINYQ